MGMDLSFQERQELIRLVVDPIIVVKTTAISETVIPY